MGQAENYFVSCKWICCSRWNFWIVENLICIAAISAAFWLNFAHSASIPSVHVMLTLQTIDIMWEYWPFSHVPEFSSLQKFMFDEILQNGPYLRNTKIQVVYYYFMLKYCIFPPMSMSTIMISEVSMGEFCHGTFFVQNMYSTYYCCKIFKHFPDYNWCHKDCRCSQTINNYRVSNGMYVKSHILV